MIPSQNALDFPPFFAWLNTDRPLRLGHELRGQVVVLDFWTYCCINCIHILPNLAWLEKKYANRPVTFIGVHSAKFSNEASPEAIRAAILRYEIQHPVIVDEAMQLWRAYKVRSWPTVVVVDAAGTIVGAVAGENNREALDQMISQALEQGAANQLLADGPLALKREGSVRSATGLAFPGKVLADAESRRLFVADSNHNRIVIAEWPGEDGRAKVVAIVGSGEIGARDGDAATATFNHPQGLAAGHGNLYVADTENHLIRKIDLESCEVTTVVGTGEMTYDFSGGGMGLQQGINSPWDLVIEGGTLYVAMAGQHQIWRIDLPVGFARALAGTGRENLADGPTETSAFSQPSGICMMDGKLFVADSEVSAIRGIDMATERVFTVLGEGLFSFGDVDGVYPNAKLQHPLGVAAWGKSLLVADTYNHKVKAVDPAGRSARTIVGRGKPGAGEPGGAVEFFEPGGLSVAGDELFVADTNNHRVVRIHLKSGEWREVVFEGLGAGRDREVESDARVITASAAAVDVTKEIEVRIEPALPEGAQVSAEAPWSIRVADGSRTVVQRTGKGGELLVRIPANAIKTPSRLAVTASFAYCTRGTAGVCVPVELRWEVAIGTGKGKQIALRGAAHAP